jgi:hypothetical protein
MPFGIYEHFMMADAVGLRCANPTYDNLTLPPIFCAPHFLRTIEVTDNSMGDAPMLPCLLEQIAEQEKLLSVSAVGAYDTKACHEVMARRGAQAIIPPRKNAKLWKEGKSVGAKVRNKAVKACQRLGCGRNGAATTGAAWSRPRCTASSGWASG